MTTLDQEKFDTLKELSEMQQTISLGRAELRKIKEETEAYMVLREKDAEERVIKVLQQSRDALDETTKNHDELSAYSTELKAYATELKSFSLDITDLFKDFNTRMKKAEEDLDKYHEMVSQKLEKIKIERVQVTEDRKLLEGERKEVAKETYLMKDRRAALERAWEELEKKLKDNQ